MQKILQKKTEDVVEVQKEKIPTNTRDENTFYDLTQTRTSQIHTDTKNRRLLRLSFRPLA